MPRLPPTHFKKGAALTVGIFSSTADKSFVFTLLNRCNASLKDISTLKVSSYFFSFAIIGLKLVFDKSIFYYR